MTKFLNEIKAAISVGVATLTAFWGWFGWLVVAWIIAMILDYITGSCAALKAGKWSSRVAREGVWHKLGAIVAVLVSGLLDLVLGQLIAHAPVTFEYTVFLCPLVLVWYILTEAGSMIENAGALGAPVPAWLQKAIAAFRDRVDVEGGGDMEVEGGEGADIDH